MRGLSSCCRLGGSSARQQSLKHLEGRPCRALSYSSYGLPRVWSPLQVYVPWALQRVAPIGAYPPNQPLGCFCFLAAASVAGLGLHLLITARLIRAKDEGASLVLSLRRRAALASIRLSVWRGRPAGAYPPSRSPQSEEYNLEYKRTRASHPHARYCASTHGHCGISSQGAVVCASKVLWYVPPRYCISVHGSCGIFSQRRCSMRLQGGLGVASCRVKPL